MPVVIPTNLPARRTLESENIFVMTEERAVHQDIRPLEIAILNIMPTKIETETQLARLLGNTPLQINLTLLTTESYQPKNISEEHLLSFYTTWSKVKDKKFDGLIVTGAPVEHLPFEQVAYWEELSHILDWSRDHVFSSLFICWGAQAALHRFYRIDKQPLPQKKFGVYPCTATKEHVKLLRGFDHSFLVPISRHTTVAADDIARQPELEIIATDCDGDPFIVQHRTGRQIYYFNHLEYDAHSIGNEYRRDREKGDDIAVPYNYFPDDDPTKKPPHRWHAHANLLFSNWVNYAVYQQTPYQVEAVEAM